MSLVSRQIAALFNGVSQQPATLRLPSQCEDQVNTYSTVADGVRKRPPFVHIAKISDTALADSAFLHTINRDTTERYIVVVTDGDLKVYDAEDGSVKTVAFPDGKSYLNLGQGADATQSFAIVSIADYSFVVNKTLPVATKTPPQSYPANNWYVPLEWNADLAWTLVQDRFYNLTTGATDKGKVQTFQDLPNPDDDNDIPPSEGDWYEVEGSDADGFGSYYVVRRGGVWEETHAFGESLGLDETTLPHALVRESDGTFSFRPFAWNVRKFGDDDSNPAPSFAGRRLNDVFYYKNRLSFVADENTVFSGASDFGNFFRNTVVDLLDSDVVDAAVSSKNVAQLKFAVPFNNGLMLFADQTQFSLNVDQLLTPRSVSIDTATEYEMSTKVRPVGIGQDVYFVTESGNHSRLREYFVQDDTNQTDATDITAHVPRYLPPDIHTMTGSSNEDVLFCASRGVGFRNRVYVYKFFWNGDDKAQSAWSYWELPSTDRVLSLAVLSNKLYALIQRSDGVYLEVCNVQDGATPEDQTGLEFDILIDRRHRVQISEMSYSSGTDRTTITLPYPLAAQAEKDALQVVFGSGSGTTGQLSDPSQYQWTTDTQVSVPGDITGIDKVYAGLKYTMTYEFSQQFVMNGEQAVTTGRLMLRTFVIYFTDTAYFSTVVSPYGTDPLEEEIVPASLSEFTGKTLGSESLITGEPIFTTGQYAFQVYGDSQVAKVVLKNDTHVQSKFQSAEWEGFYHNRARSL